MNKELKPCPFCGGKACIMKTDYPPWVIYCTICGASVHGCVYGEKEGEKAIEAWNRRYEDGNTC